MASRGTWLLRMRDKHRSQGHPTEPWKLEGIWPCRAVGGAWKRMRKASHPRRD
jgi:hypothetical protein